MKKIEIPKADASRNGLLMYYYDLENHIDTAKTVEDFLKLMARCNTLATACSEVAIEIAKNGNTPLTPLTKENKKWVKNLK